MEEKTSYNQTPKHSLTIYRSLKYLFLLVLIFFMIYLKEFNYSTNANEQIWTMVITVIVLYLIILIYQFFLTNSYKYSISSKTIGFEGGVFKKESKTIPFHKVTDVTKSQNIVEKIFGIYNLHVQTAGTPIPEISFYGLKDADTPKKIIMRSLS